MMELSDELWKEYGYVTSSTYRIKVMKSLDGKTKIPSQIAKDSDIIQNHISATLRQLKEHNLIECINPDVKKGRLYRLTDRGEELVKNL